MKLIPAALYDRLMAQHSQGPSLPTGSTETSPSQLLDSNIPDEIKAKLYHEMKRNQHNSEIAAENSPLLVKMKEAFKVPTDDTHDKVIATYDSDNNESFTTPPSTPVKLNSKTPENWPKASAKNITGFLTLSKITSNENGELVLNGNHVPGSNFKQVVKQLSDARFKKSAGYNDVIQYLTTRDLPFGMFSKTVLKDINKAAASVSKKRLKRTQSPDFFSDENEITWESF